MKRKIKLFGPGAIIAAAFIGPGTVTTCSAAGLEFGYALLWTLVFSIFATMILQEMSSRLGLVGQIGLGTALRGKYESKVKRIIIITLIVSALGIGCAAYESGNITGAALGMETLFHLPVSLLSIIIGMAAFVLLWKGSYKLIETFLVSLVVIMGITFIITAVIIKPPLTEIFKGLVPQFNKDSIYLSIGLIGTTIVPYNIFLHASIVKEKWKSRENLNECRMDLFNSILLGGIISGAIIITSSKAFFGTGMEFENAGQLAVQLQPVFGQWAKWFFSIGLFSAGISSAVTAPLAGSLALAEIFGWDTDLKSAKIRLIMSILLGTGIVFSAAGFKPVALIIFAQAANGVLLPVIVVILLIIVNEGTLMEKYRNSFFQNILGIIIILIVSFIGITNILKIFKII